jgi:hypothetical protein
MEISEEKTKSTAVTGKTPHIVKVLINNKIIEQRMDSIYLVSHISPFEHQKDTDRNLMEYNKLNEVLRRNSGKQMRKTFQIRFHEVIAKPAYFMTVNSGSYIKQTETELTVHK